MADDQIEYLRNLKIQKAQEQRLKVKAEKFIVQALSFKKAQDELAKEMGFDYSSEVFLKGDQNVIIMFNIGGLGEVNG